MTSHEAWGLGSYCYFNVNPAVVARPLLRGAGQARTSRFHNMVTVSLGGIGTINHVINNAGGTANAANQTVYLTTYP